MNWFFTLTDWLGTFTIWVALFTFLFTLFNWLSNRKGNQNIDIEIRYAQG